MQKSRRKAAFLSDCQKSGGATFLRGIASKMGLDFFEIVGPFWMRSVISDAHPPGGLLLPLRGNSPCVVGNDGLKFIPPPAGGGTLRGFPCGGSFSTRWQKSRRKAAFLCFERKKLVRHPGPAGRPAPPRRWSVGCAIRPDRAGPWAPHPGESASRSRSPVFRSCGRPGRRGSPGESG